MVSGNCSLVTLAFWGCQAAGKMSCRLANLDAPITDKPEVKAQLEEKLNAYIQWFNNGMADNNLYR